MTDSIVSIRQYLLSQEIHGCSMSSGLSRSSSIDSRYDTDSSPQRPLNESYIANLHTKLKKVSQNNNSLEKVGAKIKYQRNDLENDNQFFHCTDLNQLDSCVVQENLCNSNPNASETRSLSFQNIEEMVNSKISSFPKRKACSSIKLNHHEYQYFKNKTVTLNQFSDEHQESEESKAKRLDKGMKILEQISKEVIAK